MIYVKCESCGSEGDAQAPESARQHGFLSCPECGVPVETVGVKDYADWIERRVEAKAGMQRRGLGTRKQVSTRSDTDIDRDGLAGELPAFCPNSSCDHPRFFL